MTGRSVAGWLGLPQPASFCLGSLTCCVEGEMGEKRGGMSEKKGCFFLCNRLEFSNFKGKN